MKKSSFLSALFISSLILFSGCETLNELTSSIKSTLSGKQDNQNDKGTSLKNIPKSSGSGSSSASSLSSIDTSKWDVKTLDTARNVDYLSDIEKDVVLEMNMARTNPAMYAELYITPRIKKFNGKTYEGKLLTQEGAAVVEECAKFMAKAKPLPILKAEKGLSLAAQKHSSTQGETAQTGHTGVDGSTPFKRIEKYGTFKTAGENIAYGSNSGREIVVDLLIDDGVSSRGHRKNIMNGQFDGTGVGYTKKHKTYGSVCVITYAGGYKDK